MTTERLLKAVELALAMERRRAAELGRELHWSEFAWLVRGAFRHEHGVEEGDRLADAVLEAIRVARDEAGCL